MEKEIEKIKMKNKIFRYIFFIPTILFSLFVILGVIYGSEDKVSGLIGAFIIILFYYLISKILMNIIWNAFFRKKIMKQETINEEKTSTSIEEKTENKKNIKENIYSYSICDLKKYDVFGSSLEISANYKKYLSSNKVKKVGNYFNNMILVTIFLFICFLAVYLYIRDTYFLCVFSVCILFFVYYIYTLIKIYKKMNVMGKVTIKKDEIVDEASVTIGIKYKNIIFVYATNDAIMFMVKNYKPCIIIGYEKAILDVLKEKTNAKIIENI